MYVVIKTSVKVGISIIIAGVAVAATGLLVKKSHDSCLEMVRACERGDCSRGMPGV